MNTWNLPPGTSTNDLDRYSEIHCIECDSELTEEEISQIELLDFPAFICDKCFLKGTLFIEL